MEVATVLSRRALQTAVVLLGLVVLGTAVNDIAFGPAALPDHAQTQVNATLDSNYRFFAGVWFALGIVMLTLARRVEHSGPALRAVCGAVFLGGLARVLSLAVAGPPHPLFAAFIGVELLTPLVLVVWQSRLARSGSSAVSSPVAS
ncbi:DUF4345 domain-containing protein [Streptosporangium sp. NPDC000396]|uniref:DUF4345 domain-containing protein n=1 Tax=Streptosporangium sp. NPDC000396 TaxID=3366185 RepID=UPI00369C9630